MKLFKNLTTLVFLFSATASQATEVQNLTKSLIDWDAHMNKEFVSNNLEIGEIDKPLMICKGFPFCQEEDEERKVGGDN